MELLEKNLPLGINLGLDRTRRALAMLGNPQTRLRVILVAGTNGKGSVTTYLSNILRCTGYRVGSYYSPHLVRYSERFQINNKPIAERAFQNYQKKLLALCARGYPLTVFEALTVLAYWYFADQECDFAVMEIGLGGRLDATNVANEEIGIVTSVGLDHTDRLGRTIERIAYEKAGILKTGLAIVGPLPANAKKIIRRETTARGVRTRFFGKDISCSNIRSNPQKTMFDYRGRKTYKKLYTPLVGCYQAANASLAVAAAEELGIGKKAIAAGLRTARIAGRMQVLQKKPLVILDGAHNVPAMRELVANLRLFPYDRLVVLFAAMHDKDWKGMLDLLAPKASLLIATQASLSRSEQAGTLSGYAKKYTSIQPIHSLSRALRFALSKTKKDDMLLVCGSLYLVGDVLKSIRKTH